MEQNILLVDDEEALRITVGDRLRKEGYTVHYANDAESGLTKATSLPLDLMILDVMLPKRDGFDLCRDVRLAGLGTPILLLSARAETKDKVDGFKSGADAYVTKPFDMFELVARVEALLRRAYKSKPQDCKASRTATTARQYSRIHPITAQELELRKELDRQLATYKDSPQLTETVPRLRTMLDEERLSPQTLQARGFLSVADEVVEFLEDILIGRWSARRCP